MGLAQSKPHGSTIIICTNVLPVMPKKCDWPHLLTGRTRYFFPLPPGASSFPDPSGGLRLPLVPRLKLQQPTDRLHGSGQTKASFVKRGTMPPRVGSGPRPPECCQPLSPGPPCAAAQVGGCLGQITGREEAVSQGLDTRSPDRGAGRERAPGEVSQSLQAVIHPPSAPAAPSRHWELGKRSRERLGAFACG